METYTEAFYEVEKFPKLKVFNDNFEKILEEFKEVTASDKKVFMPWVEKELYDETNPDGWHVAPLYISGRKLEANCEAFPFLDSIVEQVPGIISASFSKLKPGTKIAAHYGYDEYSTKILRYHMGLIVPEGDIAFKCDKHKKTWQPGKSFIFDDMLEHEAWNNSEEDRVVFIADFVVNFDGEKVKQIAKEALPNEEIEVYFNKS